MRAMLIFPRVGRGRRLGVRALGFAASVAPLSGCGGKVVVDASPGVDGAGGAVASVTSSVAPESSTSTSNSASTGPVDSTSSQSTGTGLGDCNDEYCAYCVFLTQNACGIGEDLPDCVQQLYQIKFKEAGYCHVEYDAVVACLGSNTSALENCDDIGPCENAVETYGACLAKDDCGTSLCSEGSDGGCSCDGACLGQFWSAACLPTGDGQLKCECTVDGQFVGACLGQGSLACDHESGCCAAYFAQPL